MQFEPTQLTAIIDAVAKTIADNAEQVTALDQAIGDGDHVVNLQRGLDALVAQREELAQLDWSAAWQKIGMTLLTTMGGAAGSLYGTLFIAMAKASAQQEMDQQSFAEVFFQGVEAVKKRGKSDVGEKTMLDVLVPVANELKQMAENNIALDALLSKIASVAIVGMETTEDMVATKGRASFLEARSKGVVDAGARSSQLMICAVVDTLKP